MNTPWTPPYLPQGTVYGTLLNFRREHALWAPRMNEAPYQAPPQAPVLYIKTANTFTPSGQAIALPRGVPEVDVSASLGLEAGEGGAVAGCVLFNDVAVPHASYYRPPVKFRCVDGFLGVGRDRHHADRDCERGCYGNCLEHAHVNDLHQVGLAEGEMRGR